MVDTEGFKAAIAAGKKKPRIKHRKAREDELPKLFEEYRNIHLSFN
jgi:predicted RNase H-like nuclease (RuvC/YqgF family)